MSKMIIVVILRTLNFTKVYLHFRKQKTRASSEGRMLLRRLEDKSYEWML